MNNRKRYKNDALTEQKTAEFLPITAEQIAEIIALEKNAQLLLAQINRPYSCLATIAIIPALTIIICMHPSSPVYQWLSKITYTYSYKSLDSTLVNIKEMFNENVAMFKKAVSETEESVEILANNPLIKSYFAGKKITFDLILTEGETIPTSYYKTNMQIKKSFINLYEAIDGSVLMELFNKTRISHEDLIKLPTVKVFNLVKELYSDIETKLSTMIDTTHKMISGLYALFLMRKWTQASQVAMSMFSQYYVFDPLIQRIFSHGATFSSINDIRQISQAQAEKYISEKKQFELNQLIPKAQRNKKFSRSFYLIFLMVAVISIAELSPITIIFFLTWLGAASKNALQDFNDYQKTKKFDSLIDKQFALINSLTEEANFELSLVKNNTLETSYFILRFKNTKSDIGTIFKNKVAKTFKNCCNDYGIPFISHRENVVTLPINTFTTQSITLLKKNLNHNLTREVHISLLIKQIKKIIYDLLGGEHDLIFMPSYDSENTPIITIEFSIPKLDNFNFKEKLTILFKDHKITITEADKQYYVSSTGYQQLDEKAVAAFIAESKEAILQASKLNPNDEKSDLAAESAPTQLIHINKPNNATAIAPSTPIPLTHKRHLVKWPSATFDSDDKRCAVHPILFGNQIHCNSSYLKARFFATNKIDFKKVPAEIRNDVKDKLNSIIENPKLVSAEGKQGIVFCKGKTKDQNNKEFTIAAKIKCLGEFGDIRFFASSEKSIGETQGLTLLVVKSCIFKIHKIFNRK